MLVDSTRNLIFDESHCIRIYDLERFFRFASHFFRLNTNELARHDRDNFEAHKNWCGIIFAIWCILLLFSIETKMGIRF